MPTTSTSNLLPPTNLTSQDIMDLPIIFADDNQILTNNVIKPSEVPNVVETNQQVKTTPGKFVFLNKHIPSQGTSAVQTLKRPAPVQTIQNKINRNSVKYAKIILSKRINNDDSKTIVNSAVDIATKKEESATSFENIDLESELVATAVPKPNFGKDIKNITVIYKKSLDADNKSHDTITIKPIQTLLNDQLAKRAASQAELTDEDRNIKNIKFDHQQ